MLAFYFRRHYFDFCCFQLLILLDVTGQQKTHSHVVLAQTHVESLRVTVMEMRIVLETLHVELTIVLISSQMELIAVMNLKQLFNQSMLKDVINKKLE